MTRRVWRWLLAALALAPPALFVGLVTAQTVYPFGPHEAVYEVTADSRLTVDLGPIGALVMPSPAPWPVGFLGARVSVGPIPAELASADIPTVATLARDLTEYGQAYLGIDQTLRQAAIGLAADALLRAGIIWSAGLTALVLVLALLGRARRTQLTMWLGRRRVLASGTAVGAAVVGLAVATGLIWSAKPVAEPPAEPLLEGTPLAGAHLTGRLGQLIGQYGGLIVEAYKNNVAFYDAAAANVEQAFADQARAARLRPRQTAVSEFGLPLTGGDAATGPAAGEATPEDAMGGEAMDREAMDGEAMDGDGAAGDGIGGGGDGEGPDGIGGDGATALATPTASATPAWLRGEGPYGELRPALFFSDLHCNVGMAQVMGAAARALGAELVLDGGDTTMDGTAVERYCVDQIAAAIPEEAAWVAVIGNHDSVQTADQEAAAGALVLDGKVETVAGLRILGDADPTHTEVALGTSQRDQESLADVAERLADTACEDGPIDFLLVHQPAMAQVPLASGCVPAALTGHMHTRSNPKVVGGGVFYTQASTGRDNAETTNLGPLGSPAEMTILLFDSDGRIAAWQLLTVNPDASAKLSAIKAWPAAPGPDPASERK